MQSKHILSPLILRTYICVSTYTHVSPFHHLYNICTWQYFPEELYQPIRGIKTLHCIATALLISEMWTNAFDTYTVSMHGINRDQQPIWSNWIFTVVWSDLLTQSHTGNVGQAFFKMPRKKKTRRKPRVLPKKKWTPAALGFLPSCYPSAQSLLAAACTHTKGFVHVQTQCSDHVLPRNTCSCAGLTSLCHAPFAFLITQ